MVAVALADLDRGRTYDRNVARMRYRMIDLFAGCGGMTRGFVDTGRFVEPVLAVEMDPYAAATYAANFVAEGSRADQHVITERIESVDEFPRVDVVIGGPPCQGFSPLNRDGVGFERRALWREYLRALGESAASAFVMENVPGLLRSAEYTAFKALAEQDLGYTVEGRIVNAADYGVPQTRRRAIVVASEEAAFPGRPRPTLIPSQVCQSAPSLGEHSPMPWRDSPGSHPAATGTLGETRGRRASFAINTYP